MSVRSKVLGRAAVLVASGLVLGYFFGAAEVTVRGAEGDAAAREDAYPTRIEDSIAPNSAAAVAKDWERPYPQYQALGKVLMPFPTVPLGGIVPQELYRYGGAGKREYASIDDVSTYAEFYAQMSAQKPKVMAERLAYMTARYDFSGRTDPEAHMTRSKPLPVGPVVRLPKGVSSWEELAALSPEEVYRRDLFPEGFRPLSHPLHSVGHMLFPQMWTRVHPETARIDVDYDIPEAYLPEFPPPMFLTTRPDLGDVSKGREVNLANFRELFEGIVTPEQLEGLRLQVSPAPTTWFNYTKHRITKEPVRGVACLDCHVNGHGNGAVVLDPGTRPTLARSRLETPSLRGNNVNELFSLRRSIRSLDHFSEVEEYFDGDISIQPQIGGRQLDKASTNRMGDFNSIIAFPPAPKLNRLGRLNPAKANAQELRGEKLFFGRAQCGTCHPAPYYLDGSMHDLQVEEFYPGRAEGWGKTFSLRGIKDSPPYFHDGRLPTLEDTVEFFNLLLQTQLSKQDKQDLVAFMRCL
jgi:cytochrome c peroxidase